MSLQPTVMRRIMRELAQIKSNPPEGIRVSHPEDNMLDVTGIIEGPQGTPYEGGYFKIKFNFTEEFPQAPPKCRFVTKIFHPNVSSSGEICVNTLKKDWQSSFGIAHILVTVKCLLIYPNPESALDEEAGRALLEDYEQYCMRARTLTSVHAMMKTRPVEFETPSSPSSSKSPSTNSSSSSSLPATRKSPPTPSVVTSQPLHPSATISNTTPSPTPVSEKEKEKSDALPPLTPKDTAKSPAPPPAPLGPADANVAMGVTGTTCTNTGTRKTTKQGVDATNDASSTGTSGEKKAVKRPAVGNGSNSLGGRKKALKRL